MFIDPNLAKITYQLLHKKCYFNVIRFSLWGISVAGTVLLSLNYAWKFWEMNNPFKYSGDHIYKLMMQWDCHCLVTSREFRDFKTIIKLRVPIFTETRCICRVAIFGTVCASFLCGIMLQAIDRRYMHWNAQGPLSRANGRLISCLSRFAHRSCLELSHK